MKILWVSNAPFVGSGYGVGTNAVVKQLQADGHEVAVLAYWGLQGANLNIDGVEIFSAHGQNDMWANNSIEGYHQFFGSDIVLIHRDIWVNSLSLAEKLPIACWFPLDSAPVPPVIAEHMSKTRWMATMSRWAVARCAEAGYAVEYIPHSFNPEHFYYGRDHHMRGSLYGSINVPEDGFLMLIVAANKGFPSRKGYPEMFAAAGRFMRENPNAYLHVHSLITAEQGGPDLIQLAKYHDVPLKRLSVLNPFVFYHGMDPEQLGAYYRSADVLLNCSYGEGFGIPILEAQACGTPVIVTNWSSMPEICWNGDTVDGTPFVTPLYSEWRIPEVDRIYWALEAAKAQKERDPSNSRGQIVAANLADEWNDEAVYRRYWKPWLAKIQGDLDALKPGVVTFD